MRRYEKSQNIRFIDGTMDITEKDRARQRYYELMAATTARKLQPNRKTKWYERIFNNQA